MLDYGRVLDDRPVLDALRVVYKLEPQVDRCRSGPNSHVLFVRSGRARYVVKVLPEVDRDRLGHAANLARWVRDQGLPAVVPVGGSPLGYVETASGAVVVYPFVEGVAYEPGRIDQLRAAGRTLARIHRTVPPGVSTPGLLTTWPLVEEEASEGDGLGRLLDEVDPSMLDPTEVHTLHGDFRGQNLLFRGHRVAYVLDFDGFGFGCRLQDLAYALVFFPAALATSPPLAPERRALLSAYDAIYPLTEKDLQRMPHILRFATARGIGLWRRLVPTTSGRVKGRLTAWLDAYASTVAWAIDVSSSDLEHMLSR